MDAFGWLLIVVVLVVAGWLVLQSREEVSRLSADVDARASAQYRAWRDRDVEAVRTTEAAVARRAAQLELAEWKKGVEAELRADAVKKSRAVTVGKASEQIVPFLPGFTYNPKDARFLGSPVDFVIFDGLDNGAVEQVVFLEIKTGDSTLSARERLVREAVKASRVAWRELRLPTQKESSTNQRRSTSSAQSSECEFRVFICRTCTQQNRVRVDVMPENVRCGACKTHLFPPAA